MLILYSHLKVEARFAARRAARAEARRIRREEREREQQERENVRLWSHNCIVKPLVIMKIFLFCQEVLCIPKCDETNRLLTFIIE